MVIQTWTFVAFNKVMTAQYFLWYMSLMPFMMINNGVIHSSPVKGLLIYLAQIGFMCFWGYHAFQLEFGGVNYFKEINYINYGFFVINCISIIIISRNHQLTITHEISGENTIDKVQEKKDGKKVK